MLLLVAPTHAQQFVSGPSQVYGAGNVVPFKCGFAAIGATVTQCQAAAVGRYFITTLHIQTTTTTSGTYSIQTGVGSNCNISTAALFPASSLGNKFNAPISTAGIQTITFDPPIDVPFGQAICVQGVVTNTVSGQIAGFLAP